VGAELRNASSQRIKCRDNSDSQEMKGFDGIAKSYAKKAISEGIKAMKVEKVWRAQSFGRWPIGAALAA
jgi:hypothetical protein